MIILKKIVFKYFYFSLFLLTILSLSGCSFLFPTPSRRLANIERGYRKAQMDFDVTVNAPFTNDDIEQLEDEYKNLLSKTTSLLKDLHSEEENNSKPSATYEMAKEYHNKVQRKLIICEDLKD